MQRIYYTLWAFAIGVVSLFVFPNIIEAQTPGIFQIPDTNLLPEKIVVSHISISGNKKTKTYVIERELGINTGDTIVKKDFYSKLKEARQHVYNINLFSDVDLLVSGSMDSMVLLLHVKEKWYIYPTPQFQLVDRNWNEWINEHNASLNRVIYGLKFMHYNFSGRRDMLRVYLLTGYARNITIAYSNPYSNKTLTEGFGVSAALTQNREIAYKTSYSNKQIVYNNGKFVRNTFAVRATYNRRVDYYSRHTFSAGVAYMDITDSINRFYNPNYINSKSSRITFPEFGYNFRYINTNNNNYPLSGKAYTAGISKRGFGFSGCINMLQLDAAYHKYFDLGKGWYTAIESSGILTLPFKQAYINRRALGFGEMMLRGHEYFVIDGVAAAITKLTLKKKLIAFEIRQPFRKFNVIQKVPFTIFAKAFADAGYSYLPQPYTSRLNNKALYTGGFGIDILTLYDLNLRLEYSFNQLGQNGLFLHGKGGL